MSALALLLATALPGCSSGRERGGGKRFGPSGEEDAGQPPADTGGHQSNDDTGPGPGDLGPQPDGDTGPGPDDQGVSDAGSEDAGCTPRCAGRQCGSNGCGGECGTCGQGETCSIDGTCIPVPPSCGNGTCQPEQDESCANCPADCGACCGNGICQPELDESCATCPGDCGACCGNGTCQPELGESCATCPADCGACCGNGLCQPELDESCANCPADCRCQEDLGPPDAGGADAGCTPDCLGRNCGPNGCGGDCGTCDEGEVCSIDGTCISIPPSCGNGTCQPERNESCATCPGDCGACCGNGTCQPELNESCATCPGDCGACCGNGTCQPDQGESCATCPGDCGACCGNGACQPDQGESCVTCPQDCGLCCGNGTCQPDQGESCVTCPGDCGACCGNGTCQPEQGESCVNCPGDCGFCCGNGICDGAQAENCGTCPADCPCAGGQVCLANACVLQNQAPRILHLSTSVNRITQGGAFTVSVVVTDPDGIDDLIGGVLESPEGASFGAFVTSGQEGAYSMRLTWLDVDEVSPIDFLQGEEPVRTFVAVFFDQAGHQAEQSFDITLHCDGLGACDAVCTDLTTTSDCGQCGVACTVVGSQCTDGACRCVAGHGVCNDRCTDLATTSNCGACGNSCTNGGEICANGQCACPAGLSLCGASCVSLATTSNCGSCGHRCTNAGEVCANGQCACPAGLSLCGASCVSLATTSNCGACGHVCPGEGATCVNDSCVCEGACATPRAGELVITELMPNPDAVTDAHGEWFEVVNTTARELSLQGMLFGEYYTVVRKPPLTNDYFEVDEDVRVQPGQYFVFARDGNPDANGGVAVDYVYHGMNLGNEADDLTIVNALGGTVDMVEYWDDWPRGAGTSMQFGGQYDPAQINNNDFRRWCAATTPYGDGDLGSPGEENPDCD